MIDLAELRRLAEAARDAKWPDSGLALEWTEREWIQSATAKAANTLFHISCDPATILALLDRLERAEEALRQVWSDPTAVQRIEEIANRYFDGPDDALRKAVGPPDDLEAWADRLARDVMDADD